MMKRVGLIFSVLIIPQLCLGDGIPVPKIKESEEKNEKQCASGDTDQQCISATQIDVSTSMKFAYDEVGLADGEVTKDEIDGRKEDETENTIQNEDAIENGEDDDEEYIFDYDVPDSYKDLHADCSKWADEGYCNSDPTMMLRECVSSCLSDRDAEEDGLLAWGKISFFDEYCVNEHNFEKDDEIQEEEEEEDCSGWANEGLCMSPKDKDFMLTSCQKSCMVCIPEEQEYFDIGPSQLIPLQTFKETLDILIETSQYMTNTVMNTDNDFYHSTRRACKNMDELCAAWAADGLCEPDSDNFEWMVLNCAPVCQTCELLDYETRCPIPEDAVDAFPANGGEHGIHAMFERLVGERELTQTQVNGGMNDMDYRVETLSRPGGDVNNKGIVDGPWVVTIEDFLTGEECDELIAVGESLGYERSTETKTNRDGSLREGRVSKQRTSTNAWCNYDIPENGTMSCKDNPIVNRIRERIALFTTVPADNSEDLQLLHYETGQFYKPHHDFIPAHVPGPSGPRILTFFLYLNDVEEGGGTRFPELSSDADPVTIEAKRGKALVWPSVLDEDPNEKDEWTEHEALPVMKGVKYGANAWLHLRDEQNVEGIECG